MQITERISTILRGSGLKTRLLNPIDELWDRRFGIRTIAYSLEEFGVYGQPEWRAAYVPTNYRRIVAALRHVNVGQQDVVVDLGCGVGRAVFAASWLGARRSVGVEIDVHLAAQARSNIERSWLRGRDIQFVCQSAEDCSLADTTVLFMFNPFGAGTMQAVVQRLEAALRQKPRVLRVAYENPLEAALLDASKCLKRVGDWESGKYGSQHPMAFWESI